jgi:hypothetical protein
MATTTLHLRLNRQQELEQKQNKVQNQLLQQRQRKLSNELPKKQNAQQITSKFKLK